MEQKYGLLVNSNCPLVSNKSTPLELTPLSLTTVSEQWTDFRSTIEPEINNCFEEFMRKVKYYQESVKKIAKYQTILERNTYSFLDDINANLYRLSHKYPEWRDVKMAMETIADYESYAESYCEHLRQEIRVLRSSPYVFHGEIPEEPRQQFLETVKDWVYCLL